MTPGFILYGTPGCHLCDAAAQLLAQARSAAAFEWQYTDIALDADLVEKYGIRIPVLRAVSGRELDWPFSLLDVLAFVAVCRAGEQQ